MSEQNADLGATQTEMVERVANAILDGISAASLADGRHDAVIDRVTGQSMALVDGYCDYAVVARFVIAAMQTPTERMVKAGVIHDWGTSEFAARDVWGAMIDAALK